MAASNDKQKLTPVMQQYHAAKQSHPDAILFFRLGDFYEMFHDDAVVASRLLDLTLTSRNKGDPDEVPMAGVPYHAAHGYIAKLLAAGHKVAICEQIGDPSKIKGIVPREVVRVVTPGLVTDETHLDARSNNFLCAVTETGGRYGMALLDISTGECLACALDLSPAALMAEICRVEPREVVVASALSSLRPILSAALGAVPIRVSDPPGPGEIDQIIAQAIGDAEALDARRNLSQPALAACAMALGLALVCTPGVVLPVRRIVQYDPVASLQIDEVAAVHLELVRTGAGAKKGSLLGVIDQTKTASGARLLRRWLLNPLLDVAAIRRRQDAVEAFLANVLTRNALRALLAQVGDIERLAVRAMLGEASPRDLGVLRDSLCQLPQTYALAGGIADPAARESLGLDGKPPDALPELCELLARALVDRPPALTRDGGMIRDGYDPVLDETGTLQRQGADLIVALEADLRAATAISTLKVRYTRVFGWYIEVTKGQLAKVPAQWRRKQTVAGGERYTNDALDDLADRLLHAEERHSEREAMLFAELVKQVAAASDRLHSVAATLAEWDVFAALGEVAHVHEYCRPLVDDSELLQIVDGRHPVVEQLAAAGRFVSNDVMMDTGGERLWLVTGPNMAGKSTLMRQVALIVILAQMGSFVPAAEARIGLVDRVLSRVGASDDVSRGESTFMVEMRETASILRKATGKSLVILDEIGRGTSTYDGLAIAWSVAEHLHDMVRCRTLFATHYHELTDLVNVAKNAANYSVSARERGDDVVFLYKLVKGAASRSYGIAVARLAGLPEGVLARARSILSALESGSALPTGRYATLRGRNQTGQVQLDLFAPAATEPSAPPSAVEQLVRELDINRITPLEALGLIAKLKGMLPQG